MSSENILCRCNYCNCCDSIDRCTGVKGKYLNSRDFKRHLRDETEYQRRNLHQQAQDAQQAALQNQISAIQDAFTHMSINSPISVPTLGTAKYRADQKKEIIATIVYWHEKSEALMEQLDCLPTFPTPPHCLSPSDMQEQLADFNSMKKVHGEISVNLRIVSASKLSREPSVKAVLEEAQAYFTRVTGRLNVAEQVVKCAARHLEEQIKQNASRTYDSSRYYDDILGNAPAVIQLTSFMIVVCHVILRLPRRGCVWLFSMCSYIIETTVHQAGANKTISNFFADIISSFPKDVRAATNNLHIEGESCIYAVCPKCHETYKPGGEKAIPTYPERCNSSCFGNRCGEVILRPKSIRNGQVFLPIKPYIVFDMPSWIASMLARDGYEAVMDSAWKKMNSSSSTVDDIFQGSIIREFLGPDGKTHFSQAGPDDSTGRYLLSMGFDFFNPLRIIANGKKILIGVIVFTCLNLPIHIRYKPENIFLAAIIPGPKEPSLDEINPYLKPLVEVLLRLWTGIKFTRTGLFKDGRWIFCALIAVVCDLQAARKIAGLAAPSHEYFCSICWCNKTVHSYNNWDYPSWKRRTNESSCSWAEAYRHAKTEKAANSSFDKSGVRYSELLVLPYFDPTKHLVVDPMHNLFLGLVKEHFQNILGYLPKGKKAKKTRFLPGSVTAIPETPSNPIPNKIKEHKSVHRLLSYIESPLDFLKTDKAQYDATVSRWSSVHLSSLVYVAKGLNCCPETIKVDGYDSASSSSKKLTKYHLATVLLEWAFQNQDLTSLTESNRRNCRNFHVDEMQELWADIKNIVKPSWATSVPDNISSTGAKLKSDQWRSMATLFLPVTLIHIWAHAPLEEDGSVSRNRLLHLTMLLCSAVSVVSSRSTSQECINLYTDYMTQYRRELQQLFPGYICHPNHHMSLHIGEFMSHYGPVHGWWTFPFERIIGNLQRTLTNYKQGEYELTIARSWTRYSNIRALFSRGTSPDSIKMCSAMFNRLASPQNRNMLAEHYNTVRDDDDDDDDSSINLEDSRMTPIPHDISHALKISCPNSRIPRSALIKCRLSIDGVTYVRSSVHEGNSGILCHGSDVPRSIVNILEFSDNPLSTFEKHWFVLRRYRSAQVIDDPYTVYPHIRARLWSNTLEDEIEVVPLSNVKTHFAKCNMRWEGKSVIVVVSLSQY